MGKINKYEANLKYYTFLKYLVQLKLSEKQLDYVVANILALYSDSNNNFVSSAKNFKKEIIDIFESENTTGKSIAKKQKAESIITLIQFEDDETYISEIVSSAVFLYKFKNIILNIISSRVSNEFIEIDGIDYLSLTYDESTIKMPYMRRVAAPMVLREVLSAFAESEDELKKKCSIFSNMIREKYSVEVESMFDLLIVESVNQSITSNAGNSYETRFAKVLNSYNIEYQEGMHDDRQSAVEYDFMFSVNDFSIGVSLKRTLRERYKQNHRAVNELGVSKMLIVTLGTDLNEAKMENILELQGQYILVASEVYEKAEYMIECPRVFSSSNIDELMKVLGTKGY